MRSILYVAAALMIGASVYGFVDYNKTKDRKEFATMYDENETKEPVVTEKKKLTNDMVPVTKKEQSEVGNDETVTNDGVKKEENIVKKFFGKFKKKRKVNYESFSRAPLREEVMVEAPEAKEVKIKE
jgi:uncharacterized protein HemX